MNNYLSVNAMHGYSLYTLFVQPYKESYNNFLKAIEKEKLSFTSPKKNIEILFKRVKHLVCSALLFVPVLNTITLLFLRLFNKSAFNEIQKNPTQKKPSQKKTSQNKPVLKEPKKTPSHFEGKPFFKESKDIPSHIDGKIKETEEQIAWNNIQRLLFDKRLDLTYIPNSQTDNTPLIGEIREKIKQYTDDPVKQNELEQEILEQFISDIITRFTHPYLTGKMKHADNLNRTPLIARFIEKMKFFDNTPLDEQAALKLHKLVLQKYIEKYIRVIEVRYKKATYFEKESVSNSNKKKMLLEGLIATLPVDFPNFVDLTTDELAEIIKAAESKVQKEIKQEQEELAASKQAAGHLK